MCLKNISISFFLLLLIQTNNIVVSEDDGSLDYMYDMTLSFFEMARGNVQDAFDTYLPILQAMPDEISDLGNAVKTVAAVQIEVIVDNLNQEVDGLTQEAEDAGVDLDVLEECIEEYRDVLEALPNSTQREIGDCVDVIVTGGADVAQTTEEESNRVSSLLNAKLGLIDECRIYPDFVECLNKLMIDIQVTGFELYNIVATMLQFGTSTVKDMEQTLGACSLDGIDSATERGEEIISLIRVCANLEEQ